MTIFFRYTAIKNYFTTTNVIQMEGFTSVESRTKSKNTVATSTFTIVDLTIPSQRKRRYNHDK